MDSSPSAGHGQEQEGSPGWGPWWLPWWTAFLDGDNLGIDAPRSTIGAMLLAAHGSTFLRSIDDVRRESDALTSAVLAAAASQASTTGAPALIAFWNRVCTDGLGLVGDQDTYHDPRNSFLPDIRRRRTGLPIGLAMVWLHAASLLGVEAFGVGMPGHFLVGARDTGRDNTSYVYIDCFNHGAVLDVDGVASLFARMFPSSQHPRFDTAFLAPVTDGAMFIRMTANLKQHAARRRDFATLADLARLRWFLPLPSLDEGRELVRLCVATGAAGEAQHWLSAVIARFGTTYPDIQRQADHAAVTAALS